MNLKTFCEYTYNFMHIPTYIYLKKELKAQIQSPLYAVALPEMVESQILENHDTISIFETSTGSYYGQIFLHSREIAVILGPVSPLEYTEESTQKFLFAYRIPADKQTIYRQALGLIPNLSLISFIFLLYQMSYAITNADSDLPKDKLTPYRLHEVPVTAEFAQHRTNNLEAGYHNTLYESQNLTMPMIRDGDLEGLVRYSRNAVPMNYGKYSSNLREQQLTVLIISVTNAATAAIQGGLDQQTALSLSESYISKALKMTSPTDIDTLSMNAIIDFTTRVRNEKFHPGASIRPTIYDCIQYIREHVYTPVTVAEVADYSGYSMEYFSHLFKKETGFNTSTFIINCKLYESKKLLKFTNKTIGEISSQLCFSNQSHFQRLFKKKFSMTPLQYRNSDSNAPD